MRKLVAGAFAGFLSVAYLAPGLTAGGGAPPARLAQAQYVALGYDLGDRFLAEWQGITSDRVTPDEREALRAVREGIEEWGRYVIVERPDQAQLLFVIRKGRRAVLGGSLPIGTPVGGQPGRSSLRSEVSSSGDMLSIHESDGGQPGFLLWRQTQPNGLSGAPPRLLDGFMSDVNRIPAKPAKKP
jgi:hypothetical protein